MNSIRTAPTPPSRWLLGLAVCAFFFALGKLSSNSDDEELATAAAVTDAQIYAQHDVQLLAEIGQIARAAHAQGAREALAAVQGRSDGQALQRTCREQWALEAAR
ncbi:MAG: hypothetical protein E6Q67_09535 [Roseateles sp.]|nr:MAG: hypothetical protein E6Q67_09535 [Roseateles sp.]